VQQQLWASGARCQQLVQHKAVLVTAAATSGRPQTRSCWQEHHHQQQQEQRHQQQQQQQQERTHHQQQQQQQGLLVAPGVIRW
jgi:hypothetical protein